MVNMKISYVNAYVCTYVPIHVLLVKAGNIFICRKNRKRNAKSGVKDRWQRQ